MRKKKGNSQNYENGFGNFGGSGPQDGFGSYGGGASGPQDGFGYFGEGGNSSPQNNFGSFGGGGSGPQDGFGYFGEGGNSSPQNNFGSFGGGESGPQDGFGYFGDGGNSDPQNGFGYFAGSGYGSEDGLQGFGGSPGRGSSIGRIALVILAAAVFMCIAVFAILTFSGRRSGDSDPASQEGKPSAIGNEGDGIQASDDSLGENPKPEGGQSQKEDFGEKNGKETAAGQRDSEEAQQAAPAVKENSRTTAAEKERSQSAAAGKETAQDAESFTDHGYYYDFLNKKEKKAYEELIKACDRLEGSVIVDLDSEEQTQHVYCAAGFDHPEYYWLQEGYLYFYDDSGKVNRLELSVPEDAEEMISKMDSIADSVIGQIPEKSAGNKYETVKWFYEYLIQTVDYQNASNDQIASSALLDHRSVCAGYSRAFKLLCDKAGIECVVVFGMCQSPKDKEPQSHVWNMVFIDGTSFWVDVTWGDTFFSDIKPWTDGLTCYDYLCALDKSILKDHTINYYPCCEGETEDLYIEYPACTDDKYIYCKRKGTMFHTVEEGEDYISKSVSAGQKTMVFAFDDEEAYSEMVAKLKQGDPVWELIDGAGAHYKSMQYLMNDPYLSIFLELR